MKGEGSRMLRTGIGGIDPWFLILAAAYMAGTIIAWLNLGWPGNPTADIWRRIEPASSSRAFGYFVAVCLTLAAAGTIAKVLTSWKHGTAK